MYKTVTLFYSSKPLFYKFLKKKSQFFLLLFWNRGTYNIFHILLVPLYRNAFMQLKKVN